MYILPQKIFVLFCLRGETNKQKQTDLGIKKGKLLMGSSTEACPNHLLDIQSHLNSLVAQTVKCLPTVWETRVRFLGQEDPLEKEMATHSNTLAWKIP